MSVHLQSKTSRRSSSRSSNSNRCSYCTSDNRRCAMLRHNSHPALCLFHAREERRILEADRVGNELATLTGEFRTTTDINHALGKLWNMLAHDRISRKRAATMAYIAALLLPTVERVRLERSMAARTSGFDYWKDALARAFPPPKSTQPTTPEK